MSCLYTPKLELLIVFQKRNWSFAFAFEHLWPDFEHLNLLFPLKLHPATLERQPNYLKCFVTMPLWQSINLGIILCHQSFLLHWLSLACWKILPFLESIWFLPMILKTEHLITLVNSNAASREPLIIFIALMVSPSTNWRAWTMAICQMDSISFMQAATPVVAPTMLDAPSGPNLNFLCVQQ